MSPKRTKGKHSTGESVGARLAELETEIKHLATKADIKAMESSMLKWQLAILIGVILAFVGIIFKAFPVISALAQLITK